MRNIIIADVTLKETADRPEFPLSFKEKIEIAKLLDKLCVAVIETAPITNEKIDSLLVKSMAAAVRSSVLSVPVGLSADSVPVAWESVKTARRPRLRVCVPTSSVQMEYLCRMKAPALLQRVTELVSACRALCADVEFVAEDATRAEPDFLSAVLTAAVAAGAGTVTICDTAGIMLPDEFSAFVSGIRSRLPAGDVSLGICCSNELNLAAACSVAAIQAGCSEIKVSASADHMASLEAVAQIIRTRGETLGFGCGVRYTQLQRSMKQIRWITHSHRSKTSPFENGVQSGADTAGIELTVHDDLTAVSTAVLKLGYDLSEEDLAKVYEEFLRIADKKAIGPKELEVIVASVALQVPPTYQLESYVINSVNTAGMAAASAHIILKKGDRTVQGICPGDGPVDASFLAIEQIVGHHYELDDFQIQSVTEGREAMGATLVRLRSNGKLYSGRGVATDIIGSSIRAYLNALNKIVYEEV